VCMTRRWIARVRMSGCMLVRLHLLRRLELRLLVAVLRRCLRMCRYLLWSLRVRVVVGGFTR
jgi:hypothetical protein